MDEEFEQLRREYYAALAKRAKEVALGLASLQGASNVEVDSGPWTSVLYVAHKTAGLAATYDLPCLTDICGAIDEGMQALKTKGTRHVSIIDFQAWCAVLKEGLEHGSQGKDPTHIAVPQL